MKLNLTYDTEADIPEGFASLYTQRGDKFEFTGVEGIRTQADVDRVQAALVKERNDHKALREKYRPLGDLNPADIVQQLDRIPELEMAAEGKLDDTKINSIVEQRIRSKIAPIERERDLLTTQLAEAQDTIQNFTAEKRQNTIASAIRSACTSNKVVPDAVDDAVMLGERMFTIDETGRVVTRDDVGVTPGVDARTWLTEMQPKRPHWWPASQGGGATGSGGAGAPKNPWKKESFNLTEQGRLTRENPQLAENMKKAAGV